jgi:hypothetical protein
MSAFKIKTYKFDLDKLKSRINHIMSAEKQWLPATPKTPNAVWADISDVLDNEFKQALSSSVGTDLYEIFWITDYRDCKDLEMHMDNPGNEYTISPRFTCILMLEGTFEVPIWDDDQTTIIDTAVIKPGEFVVLNFCEYYHSGRVIEGNKVSLHFYPKIPHIDGSHKNEVKLKVEDYV